MNKKHIFNNRVNNNKIILIIIMNKYKCPLCLIDPLNHSLNKLFENDKEVYYYSCPSNAKLYYDANSIINHYTGELSEISPNKEWIWICDSINFGFKHFIQYDVGIELAKLISLNFSKNLKKIIIINPTIYISSTYTIIKPFLNEKVKNLIEFKYDAINAFEIISEIED